jgi:hypothetical protein
VHRIHLPTFPQYFPIPASIPPVLPSPHTEIPPPRYSNSATVFIHQPLLSSLLNFGIEYNFTPSTRPPKFGAIAPLLLKAVGAQSCPNHRIWLRHIPADPSLQYGCPHQILNNSTNFAPNHMPQKCQLYTCPIYPTPPCL